MSPEKSMSFTRKFKDLFPERPKQPVAPKIIGKQTFKHGERWSVEYSASRGERVCAYVLIPKKTGNPLPAILASHQHNGQYHLGKSETAGLAGNPEIRTVSPVSEGLAVLLNLNLDILKEPGTLV